MNKHFNFNSVLISLGCVLATFCLKRADEINTKVITLTTTQNAFVERLERIEKDMVLRTEFRAEIDRIEREIQDIEPTTHHQAPLTKYHE